MTIEKVKNSKQIKVTQVGSAIGKTVSQKKTLLGLGLKKINSTKILDDNPSVRGMVEKVKHLVNVETV